MTRSTPRSLARSIPQCLSLCAFAKRLPLALGFLTLAPSCSSQDSTADTPPTTAVNAEAEAGQCHTPSDCRAGQLCLSDADEPVARRELLMVAPCMPVLLGVPCFDDSQCAAPQICPVDQDPLPPYPSGIFCPGQNQPVCSAACTETSCAAGSRCEADGHCRLIPCDDPAGACPENFYCDAATAAAKLQIADVTLPGGLDPTGALVTATSRTWYDYHRMGCLLLHCDEAGGAACSDGYVCDRSRAPSNSIGCVALTCEEWGQCQSESSICEPTSPNTRYEGTDPHGCVQRNCEEGQSCGTGKICDFSRPNADINGCDYLRCDEAEICNAETAKCAPEDPLADVYGCAPLGCTEGYVCAAGLNCEPENVAADRNGCIFPGPATPAPTVVVTPQPTVTAPNPPTPESSAPVNGSAGAESVTTVQPEPDDVPSEPVTALPPVRPEGAPLGSGCENDIDCETGYCVNGSCHSGLGVCQ